MTKSRAGKPPDSRSAAPAQSETPTHGASAVSGQKTYQYSTATQLNQALSLLFVVWLLGTGAYYILTTPPASARAWVGLLAFLVLVSVSGIVQVRRQLLLHSKITLSDTGMHWGHPAATRNFIAWHDIKEVRQTSRFGDFKVISNSEDVVIPVKRQLLGLDELREHLRSRTGA